MSAEQNTGAPEIRDDPRGTWAIVAPNRSARANAFTDDARPIGPEDCPFCPGHEERTPPEIERTGGDRWTMRVVPNMYPAVSTGHEVLIETPEHSISYDALPIQRAADILEMHRRRYERHRQGEQVIIFRNDGARAGASIPHPHSQLIALDRVTPRMAREIHAAEKHCWACDPVPEDLLLTRTANFSVVALATAPLPCQLAVVPRRHAPNFCERPSGQELAQLLQSAIRAFRQSLGVEDYNWVYLNAKDTEEYFHWYLEITPRMTTLGGFELASQTSINVVAPERAARQLRPWFEESA